jgi:hypothetical protein
LPTTGAVSTQTDNNDMNAKSKFNLPKTPSCVVVWYRNGNKNETLIPTPASNTDLVHTMLMSHRVGFSEIRAVKAVETDLVVSLQRNMMTARRDSF